MFANPFSLLSRRWNRHHDHCSAPTRSSGCPFAVEGTPLESSRQRKSDGMGFVPPHSRVGTMSLQS